MKISITLPSIFPEACKRAINNINATTSSAEIEILVVSPFPVEAKNVVWIEEKQKRGCTVAHNTAFDRATGDFITATADDCDYVPGWDQGALANYIERAPKGRMFCLGLHYGLVGTVYGIYYANFPFLNLNDARQIGYFDARFKRGFTDSDLSFKIWDGGGRCEFSKEVLIKITAEDKRKGGEECPPEDLRLFVEKWGSRYGVGFDSSYMRGINLDFDPSKHQEFVDDFSIYRNTPEFADEIAKVGPPHLVRSVGEFNIVKYQGRFHVLPKNIGMIDLEKEWHPRIRSYAAYPTRFAEMKGARPSSFLRRTWGRLRSTPPRKAFAEQDQNESPDRP